MFVAAKVAGEILEPIRQPPVIGEILVGIALGSHALGLIRDSDVNIALQQLGAIALLFMVGLDVSLQEVKEVGARALTVGGAGTLEACGRDVPNAIAMASSTVSREPSFQRPCRRHLGRGGAGPLHEGPGRTARTHPHSEVARYRRSNFEGGRGVVLHHHTRPTDEGHRKQGCVSVGPHALDGSSEERRCGLRGPRTIQPRCRDRGSLGPDPPVVSSQDRRG